MPPRDITFTAQRIIDALLTQPSRPHPLYYLDLNAKSPRSARATAALFTNLANIRFADGCIIGAPPKPKFNIGSEAASTTPGWTYAANNSTSGLSDWNQPVVAVSGPHTITEAPVAGAALASTLKIQHIDTSIGPTAGLKCCFATITKGFTALAIQAFTTAEAIGVLPELRAIMADAIPERLAAAERGVTSMPPKAYRWVREMQEIGICHADVGGFVSAGDAEVDGDSETGGDTTTASTPKNLNIFDAIANVYEAVADDTVLGQEKTESRKRGRTIEDVAIAMGEGLQAKYRKRA